MQAGKKSKAQNFDNMRETMLSYRLDKALEAISNFLDNYIEYRTTKRLKKKVNELRNIVKQFNTYIEAISWFNERVRFEALKILSSLEELFRGLDTVIREKAFGKPKVNILQTYDPYEILGIDRNATEEQIKARYKELMKRIHPDVGGSNALCQIVNKAYKDLIGKE